MASKNSKTSRPNKPKKPSKDFPLTPNLHTNRWVKKIRGKIHYFGPLDNPDAALAEFERQWPYLSEGRTPPPVDTGGGCTIRHLCNAFLNSKRSKMESGELAERSFRDYYAACERLVKQFGRERRVDDLRPDDFEAFRLSLSRTWGSVRMRNEINRFRVVFKFAYDQRLIDQPVAYGQSFARPSAKVLRRARNEAGPRLFEADELRMILGALYGQAVVPNDEGDEPTAIKAEPIMRAMVLLGVNCGFGNTDVASLPQSAVDLDGGWIEFPRPKTEIQRRIPLWPETVDALRQAIDQRPKPKRRADGGLCFLTHHGTPWVRVQVKVKTTEGEINIEEVTNGENSDKRYVPIDSLSPKMTKLLKRLKINGRPGLGFYTLRHVFETIAGESKDQVAVNSIMGHADDSMAAVYRERISDARLQAVVAVVRDWLFGDDVDQQPEAEKPKPRKRRAKRKAKKKAESKPTDRATLRIYAG